MHPRVLPWTALLTLAACTSDPSSPPARPPTTPPASTAKIAVALTVNDGASDAMVRGFALAVRAGVTLLEPPTGDRTVPGVPVLAVSGPDGASASWPFVATALVTPVVLNAGAKSASAAFTLDEAETGAIAAGHYTIQLTWGDEVSEPVEVDVVDAPAEPDAGQRTDRARQLADVLSLRGDLEGALAAVEAALAGGLEPRALLPQKALLLKELGRKDEALAAINAAIGLFVPVSGHPPSGYLALRRELGGEL